MGLKRLYIKSDWVDGRYITMLKYGTEHIDISAFHPLIVNQIEEWCSDAVNKAYELGLKEGAEIAKNVYRGEK